MPTNELPVVLPAEALDGPDAELVDANIDVVNAMYTELLGEDEIAANALRSYYVDFFLTEVLDGGFAQYVVSAGERGDLDRLVREGLREMGAPEHLALFDAMVAAFDGLDDDDAAAYLEGDGGSDAVEALEALDDRVEEVLEDEDLVSLNGAWLRRQEHLLALDEDGIDDEIARRVALVTDLDERRAEAQALEDEFSEI
ncbi:DMP19 family protein [Sinomonas sp.]|uniref:DMP19 family protein n=1 Tax=Sinomonas sp. TaxID=1914986 RepID=UPI003F7E2E57